MTQLVKYSVIYKNSKVSHKYLSGWGSSVALSWEGALGVGDVGNNQRLMGGTVCITSCQHINIYN